MKNYKFAIAALAILLCIHISSCAGDPDKIPNPSQSANPIIDYSDDEELDISDANILFIGNSLTYTNDLPSLVRQLGKNNGADIGIKSVTRGNYALIDHWNDGIIQQEIKTGKYDFVVVQQGPSSQAFGREVLIEYGKLINDLCEKHNAKMAYYMVWPSQTYYHTFDGVIKNHEDAANINKALLCPVGKVWKQYFDATSDFSYYGSDGFHPSLKGSKVAAKVIVESLFK